MPCPIYRVTPRIPQAQGILLNRQNQVQVGFYFFSCSSSNPHALRNDKTILNLEKSSLLGRTVSLSLVTWKIFTASPYISRIVLLLAQAGIPSCRPPFPHESGKHFLVNTGLDFPEIEIRKLETRKEERWNPDQERNPE